MTLSRSSFDRRHFLASAAAAPAWLPLLRQPAALAETAPSRAPYLKLQPFIPPGRDDFASDTAAMAQEKALEAAVHAGRLPVTADFRGLSISAAKWNDRGNGIRDADFSQSQPAADAGFGQWLKSLGNLRRFRFFVLPGNEVRFEAAGQGEEGLVYATGLWEARWNGGKLQALKPLVEERATAPEQLFRDVTGPLFEASGDLRDQLTKGVPYWRARLDPALGIDVYGSNGIAVGDIDGDGEDEVYVCQPGGLPNRLLKFTNHRLEDITQKWGVALLDDTSSALFLDLRNTGRQDLVVLRSSGPLLCLNEGAHFRLRDDAFQFQTVPQGGFTGMAAADYDRDGKLDLYLCTYVYFQSEAQYTYPVPYHDARNGPPNFLFHNRLNADGTGSFEDVTMAAGINENNNRFSFAPAWCDTGGSGWPDLYVANDFGRNNFYRNREGMFRDEAAQAGIEDLGPGMSACWFDDDQDGRPDLYVANMWSAAGQRVVHDPRFAPAQGESFAEAYRRHTKGNSLYHQRSDGTFDEVTAEQHAAMGRWAWSSVGRDVDNDGQPEILIGCGMLSSVSSEDLMSFFWRQVVAKSPQRAQPSPSYENGWNAINQFLREDLSWNGNEPNVFLRRSGNRYFDVSGISGFDWPDDTRAFAVVDFDGDGRPDLLLKSRLGPQLRVLQNNCNGENHSIAFELTGTRSNRDAIGTKIDANGHVVWLSAETGYLSQHSKRVIVGLGPQNGPVKVQITWPSGAHQEFASLQPGYIYRITEGTDQFSRKPFAAHKPWPQAPLPIDNQPRLHSTWLIEPVPIPAAIEGPALLVLHDGSARLAALHPVKTINFSQLSAGEQASWRVFRRYLFDWRHDLDLPFSVLIDQQGRAVKVYDKQPGAAALQHDLAMLDGKGQASAVPFTGVFHRQPRRDYFKFAAALLWEGQTQAALPYLQEALRRGSANGRIPLLIGQIHLEAGKADEAERYIKQALAQNEQNADAWLALSGVSDAQSKPAEARRSAERAAALAPTVPYILVGAAQACEKAGDPKAAETYYRRALEADPNDADAANGLGLLLAKAGNMNEAKRFFERAVALRHDFGPAINNLAVLYLNTGQLNDAVAAFEYGLRAAPDEDILYLNLGRIYARQGQTERAKQVMQQLLARKPGDPKAERALQELEQR